MFSALPEQTSSGHPGRSVWVQCPNSAVSEERHVHPLDNGRGSGWSEVPLQAAEIVIHLRRLYRAKHESGRLLQNAPDLRVESVAADDLPFRFIEGAVRSVDFSNRLRPTRGIPLSEDFEQVPFQKEPSASLMTDPPAQNMPFGLAQGTLGASHGAEFFGSPTTCKTSQCSIALPSASIL